MGWIIFLLIIIIIQLSDIESYLRQIRDLLKK